MACSPSLALSARSLVVQHPFWERGLQLVSCGFRGRDTRVEFVVPTVARVLTGVARLTLSVLGSVASSRRGYSLMDSPVRFRAFLAHSSIRSSFPWPFAFVTCPIVWCDVPVFPTPC
jgi:hypothetical protein